MAETHKIHVKVEKEVLLRVLPVVAEEYNGNLSQFVRVCIFNELLRRNLLTQGELSILKDR